MIVSFHWRNNVSFKILSKIKTKFTAFIHYTKPVLCIFLYQLNFRDMNYYFEVIAINILQ